MREIASHQTIRLSRGSHRSPGTGACAMELASMLAGERFTDHPRAVCPILAAFLRRYNDGVDDERRQDLLPLVPLVVGTRGPRAVRAQRAELCHAEVAALSRACRWRAAIGRRTSARFLGELCAERFLDAHDHAGALAFVRALASVGAREDGVPAALPETRAYRR